MRKKFILCGLTGWCMEILFTAFNSFRRRDWKLTAQTSLWMFPIYGMAAFLSPLYNRIKKWHLVPRGILYAAGIYLCEFLSGSLLSRFKACPWDYSKSKSNIKGIIRLDYAPFWFLAGLLFEQILLHAGSESSHPAASKTAAVTKNVD